MCLHFGRNIDRVIANVDSDFAGDLDKWGSPIGYVFTIGGCAISWKVNLQTIVVFSTTEIEYMAISMLQMLVRKLFGWRDYLVNSVKTYILI